MKKMTATQALAWLNTAVAERGSNFKYSERFGYSCMNVVDGEPACIVGLALWRFGEHVGLPEDFMLRYAEGSITRVARQLREDGILDVSKKAMVILGIAQGHQDYGDSWGDAVYAARIASRSISDADL